MDQVRVLTLDPSPGSLINNKGPAAPVALSPDGDSEDADDNGPSRVCNGSDRDNHRGGAGGSVSAGEEEGRPEEEEAAPGGISPLCSGPPSDSPSPTGSPGPPESRRTGYQTPLSDGDEEEPVPSPGPGPEVPPLTENGASLPRPLSPVVIVDKCCGQTCNGTSTPPSPRSTGRHKRKREEPRPEDHAAPRRYAPSPCFSPGSGSPAE